MSDPEPPAASPPSDVPPPPPPKADPKWLQSLSSWLPPWAVLEVREVSAAPGAIAVLLALGGIGGWWAANYFYAERIEVLNARIAGLEGDLNDLKPPVPRTVDLEMTCRLQALGTVTFNDRITVWTVNANDRSGFAQRWGEMTDDPSGIPSRHRCEIVNRGTMTVHNAWLDANFVLKEVVLSDGGKGRSSGKILASHNRSLMLDGAIDGNSGKRDFWVWQDATDVFADVQFGDMVFVTDPDGRSGRVPLRLSGTVGMTLLPRKVN